jgi:hypothetical protein
MSENAAGTAHSPAGLLAELWYTDPPDLDDPDLVTALRRTWPRAEVQASSLTVPHDREVLDAAGEVEAPPLLSVVVPGSPVGHSGKTLPDVSQTWDWAEAEQVVAGARHSLLVTEMLAADAPAADRVAALTEVVAELVRATAPLAISWPHSQRVSDPRAFVADDLDGVINVRLFAVAGEADTLVMDTLGLHVFGLPDLQCHFRGRDPGEIATLLYSTAVYVFDSGDVIYDGNTISGPDGKGRFVCHHEPSLLEPRRVVLDIDLGDPHAAGERDRN